MDYKYFDVKNIKPVFPFGHGLSYTSFQFSNLKVNRNDNTPPIISVSVQNTGPVEGNEVVQLYLGLPESSGEPPKMLKGFDRKMISPKESVDFLFPLTWDDVSIYDVNIKGWRVPDGKYLVHVGASSGDLRLTGSFSCTTGLLFYFYYYYYCY